jgi:hypothetical protein
MSQSPSVSVERDIAAPASRVWSLITNIDAWPSTIQGIVSVERLDGGSGFGEGTRWRESRRILGKVGTEERLVTAIDPGRSFTAETENRGTYYVTTYAVTPAGPGSRLTIDFTTFPAKPPGFFGRMVAGLGLRSVRNSLELDLVALAMAAERGTGRVSP